MPNINDPKSPDNSSSTIRNLFKQNEEAYRKYHEEERAEKEKAEKEKAEKEMKLQESGSSENNDTQTSSGNTDTQTHTSGNKKKRRKRSRNKNRSNYNSSTNISENNSSQESKVSQEDKPVPKPETKSPDTKEDKPAPKTEVKSQGIKEDKPAPKPEVKSQAIKEDKPAPKPETKSPDTKDNKPDTRPENNPQDNNEAKSDYRPQNKSYKKHKNNHHNNQKQMTDGNVQNVTQDKQIHNPDSNMQADDHIKQSHKSEGANRNNDHYNQRKKQNKSVNGQNNKFQSSMNSKSQGDNETGNSEKPKNKQENISENKQQLDTKNHSDGVDKVKTSQKKTDVSDNTSEAHIKDIYQDVKPDEELTGQKIKKTVQPEPQKPQSKIAGKFKSFFDKLVNAMKQQPEENTFEDDVDEFVLADEDSAADLDAVKKNYRFLSLRPRELDEVSDKTSDEDIVQPDDSHIVIKTSGHSDTEPVTGTEDDNSVVATDYRNKMYKKSKQKSDKDHGTSSNKESEKTDTKPETAKTQEQSEKAHDTKNDKTPETSETKSETETAKTQEQSEKAQDTESDMKSEISDESSESKADEADSEYDMSNLIYSAPDQSNSQKRKKDNTEKAEQEDIFEDIMPQRQKSERPKKELPVFDIFAEYAKENGIKPKDKTKSDIRKNQTEPTVSEPKDKTAAKSDSKSVSASPVADRPENNGSKKSNAGRPAVSEGERLRKREVTAPKRNLPFILNDDDFKSDKSSTVKSEESTDKKEPFILSDDSAKTDKDSIVKAEETNSNKPEAEEKLVKSVEEKPDKTESDKTAPSSFDKANEPESGNEQTGFSKESGKAYEKYNNPFVTDSDKQTEPTKASVRTDEKKDSSLVKDSDEQPEAVMTDDKAEKTSDNAVANEADEQSAVLGTHSETEVPADIKNSNSADEENAPTKEENAPPKKVSRFKADDLPGGDGIRILPWEPPKAQPEPIPEQPAQSVGIQDSRTAEARDITDPSQDGKAPVNNINDFREGSKPEITYKYSSAAPFIVMAGKFTKTLRGEYEAVRMFRNNPPEPVRTESIDNGSNTASVIRTSAPVAPVEVRKDDKKPKPKSNPKSKPEKKAAEKSEQKPAAILKSLSEAEPLIRHKKKKRAPEPPAEKKLSNITKLPIGKLDDIDEPEEEENTNVIKLRSERQKAAKKKKDRKKVNFRYFFDTEEEYVPDDTLTPQELKSQIDDYNDEKDADAIGTEIATNFQTVFARTIVLSVTTALSIILALVGQCTSLFSETLKNGWLWFALFSFMIFAVSVIASRMPIMSGLMPLRRFKGNSDTAVSIASIAVAIQSVTAIFVPDVYVNGTMYIYVPLAVTALLFNSIGKLLMILRTHNNFAYLRKPFPKYAGKIFTDVSNAEKMVSELPSHRAIIGYTKRAKFMSNFLQLSYAPDPSEELAAMVAPYSTILSIVCGVAYGIMTQDFVSGVSSFALTACMSVPMICLVAVNIPLRRLCKDALRSGAMITSYETVKQFSDTNAIMIDSSQLYPKGSVTLDGMKAFKQSKLNDAILSGAAIMNVVNGTMIHAFENIVQCSKDMLPKVDNVIYEDGKGLVGWVKGQRVLIGNRELLQAHNITPPDISLENRYKDTGSEITYISVSGELIAMFVLSYKTDRNIARELKNLEQNGVSFVVRTVDANITKEKIAERFGLYHRCITVLPTGLGNICREAMFTTDDTARAYLVTRGKLSSFAKAVAGCIKIKSNVTISKILQYVAIVSGLIIVIMFTFVSGFEKLGCLEMLIYSGFWSLTSILVTMIRK